ncbi:MAG: redox-sensing transcriptional repressor Rex [Planctomycetota bacterium]|jgi:redox-sensing transcriptional repressor
MRSSQAEPGQGPDPKRAPEPAVTRLPLYLRHLETTVSSSQLGKALGSTAAQVRKDLACFGQFGRPGVGYPVADLAASLRHVLGTHMIWKVALVGVGNLGSALLSYAGFRKRGFAIACAFDADRAKIGRKVGGVTVRDMKDFARCVSEKNIVLGMIAVGADQAQKVANTMVAAGVRGILNLAPIDIEVPKGALVYTEDLAVGLEQIAYHLARKR